MKTSYHMRKINTQQVSNIYLSNNQTGYCYQTKLLHRKCEFMFTRNYLQHNYGHNYYVSK
jgi:hypothetical protein